MVLKKNVQWKGTHVYMPRMWEVCEQRCGNAAEAETRWRRNIEASIDSAGSRAPSEFREGGQCLRLSHDVFVQVHVEYYNRLASDNGSLQRVASFTTSSLWLHQAENRDLGIDTCAHEASGWPVDTR